MARRFRCLLIWLTVALTHIFHVKSNCPCLPAPNLFYNYTAVTICVRNFDAAALQHPKGNVVGVDPKADASNCTVVIEVGRPGEKLHTSDRKMCPGVCGPVPTVSLQHAVLLQANSTEGIGHLKDHAVTCSMTAHMASRSIKHDSALVGMPPLHQFLFAVADRALLECYEHPRRMQDSTSHLYPDYSHIPRRTVKAVVIWVGSVGNMKLINQQAMMLAEQAFHGTDAVIAWAATDQQYGCTKEESVCIGNNGRFKYLPKSDINFMRPGWGCAQRRPLRALAHVLKLFDPQFIVSLDDDSFLNYPLLMERYGELILEKMRVEPLFMGELSGRTGMNGDLTLNGLFVGGAGYVFGRKVLSRLVRTEIHAYGYETWPGHLQYPAREKQVLGLAADSVRTADHIRHLSLLTEGVSLAAEHCPVQKNTDSRPRGAQHAPVLGRGDASTDHNSCIHSLTPRISKQKSGSHQLVTHEDAKTNTAAPALDDSYKTVPLAVRLIDFCVNVMAAAHTCQHSDHSLGRCLVYGAHATPLALSCHSEEPLPEIRPEMLIGMCQFAPVCNTTEQVTCHRYKPMLQGRGANAVIVPVRVTHRRVYYKEYSTLYNPNATSAYPV